MVKDVAKPASANVKRNSVEIGGKSEGPGCWGVGGDTSVGHLVLVDGSTGSVVIGISRVVGDATIVRVTGAIGVSTDPVVGIVVEVLVGTGVTDGVISDGRVLIGDDMGTRV